MSASIYLNSGEVLTDVLSHIFKRCEQLGAHRKVLREYLDSKAKEEDLHAVADAAMDLRDLDVETHTLAMIRDLIEELSARS